MAWLPRPDLIDRINQAARELKLARKDGSCEWIKKAAKALDDLLDQIPRETELKETAQ